MKHIWLALIFVVLFINSALSVAETKGSTVKQQSPFEVMPFALPKAKTSLYKDYRKTWHRLTGFEYSGLHWQQFVSIYVNQDEDIYRENYLAYLAIYREDEDEDEDEDETDEVVEVFKKYSIGTIFLKENYLSKDGRPGMPSTLTIMIKRELGYDLAGGDWQYIQTDTKGNLIMQGDSKDPVIKQICSDCHSNMAERDYIFSTFLTSNAVNN